MFRVQFKPNTQLLNANCPDFRQLVPVTVHKHTTEHATYHGGNLLAVLLQLQDTHMEHAYIMAEQRHGFCLIAICIYSIHAVYSQMQNKKMCNVFYNFSGV